jgi:hypothetical protein
LVKEGEGKVKEGEGKVKEGEGKDMKYYLLSIGEEYLETNRNSQESACVFMSNYF